MTWAYSPSYGKPLSVPQGVIGLMTRFGMDVTLAYPEGYHLIPEAENLARKFARENDGQFEVVHRMEDAFADAHVVYPKSWAPYSVMEQRTELLKNNDTAGLKSLEEACLAKNAEFKDWECTEEIMRITRGDKALYMHCLPADITGDAGEVRGTVFDRYRIATYRQAGFKPYIIAAMMIHSRFKDPVKLLDRMMERGVRRAGV